jgi:hypothetical protein
VWGSVGDLKGIQIASYTWGLENITNSVIKAYAIWKGIKIMHLILFPFFTLLAKFEEFKIFHIKSVLNTSVDYWAKLGSRLSEGNCIVNGVRGVLPHTII